jgi:pleiotropic regulator 1
MQVIARAERADADPLLRGGSAAVSRRLAAHWPRPKWHAPWRCYRVMSGHTGWVRSVAFDASNRWFATGAADRTIKLWDTASGQLKITLTGHTEQVTGLAVSSRHPYMYSCGLDKTVKCWDLETNRVIRHYHGHLSGVYCLALHPTLDLLVTGGRDAVARVWDCRTKLQAWALEGHSHTVAAVACQSTDPQVITGSHDATVRLWDLRKGQTMATLTHHKKAVRGLAVHAREAAFVSAGADNLKKFALPRGDFLHNLLQRQGCIVNALALSSDSDVLASGGDDGSLWFWDWRSGNCFQKSEQAPQPGSLEGAEAGVFAAAFDLSGSRLVTCGADKTVRMWREDENATEETFPVEFEPPSGEIRF